MHKLSKKAVQNIDKKEKATKMLYNYAQNLRTFTQDIKKETKIWIAVKKLLSIVANNTIKKYFIIKEQKQWKKQF